MAFNDSSAEFDIFLDLLDKDRIKEIGKGANATVYFGINKLTSENYAVKKIYKEKIKTLEQRELFSRESRVLENNRSPYLIRLLGKFETEDCFVLVTEYAARGDFYDFSLEHSIYKFTEDQARVYGAEIVHAIKELHSRGIIHRDIKQENILMDDDGHLKLADFGLCKDGIDEDNKATSFCGTPCFMAPEVIAGRKYDFAADWWGFGIFLYEMICGKLPFTDDNHSILYDKILYKRPKFPRSLSPEAKDLLKNLLKKNPEKRLGSGIQGIEKILNHPFFAKINWQEVDERKIEPPFGKINHNDND